ncbi:hypothetical protein B2J93_9219 [Marssonina coronariae]|uniref:BZIP domain-containing protein n=1 Tax=Diplocarpon coronariae TaxID=2795749 RepID=A0A218ZH10_9HELO|nr:hypothetical protein B2J93_9219 [Marssonina coronariae]
MATPSEKANLARIRDNQRRSRTRRKEYLQELEARLRQCELVGVEASSEIQTAARKVADENKKLRSLLAQYGVRDDSVEIYLQSFAIHDAGMSANHSASVQVLEQFLSTRKSCCGKGTASIASYDHDSPGSATNSQPGWDQSYSQNTSSRQRSGKASFPQQFMTSTTSHTSTTTSTGHDSIEGGPHYKMITPTRMPGPASSNQTQQILEYGQQFPQPGQLHFQQHSALHEQLLHQNGTQRSSANLSPTVPLNVNNCNSATDIFTSMMGVADPSTVGAELGCVDGMDFDVDNQVSASCPPRYFKKGSLAIPASTFTKDLLAGVQLNESIQR